MPLPMTPTVFTVFTRASASACSRLPFSLVIMATVSTWSKVELGTDTDRRVVHGQTIENLAGAGAAGFIEHRDARDGGPGHRAVHQALGHASLFAIRVSIGVCPVRCAH